MIEPLEWRAIAISELIDLLYLLNSDPEFKQADFQQRILMLSENKQCSFSQIERF
ncbi:hypothetical protein Lepto7375DRAFT_7781 [Leptolyngbya sp. PCC 7375]|nr:hypothetical protein Lepto7375DRAFT_7781 [Leptolyngbya sp. PCC 7375]